MFRPRPKPRPITEAVLRAFKKLPEGTNKEIAALAGTRHEYVRTVLMRAGLELARKPNRKSPRTTPVRKYKRLQEWEREAIALGYKDGEKLSALAVEFGVDDSTVSRIAERHGLPRRKAGRPEVPNKRKAESFSTYKKRLAAQRRAAVEARQSG